MRSCRSTLIGHLPRPGRACRVRLDPVGENLGQQAGDRDADIRRAGGLNDLEQVLAPGPVLLGGTAGVVGSGRAVEEVPVARHPGIAGAGGDDVQNALLRHAMGRGELERLVRAGKGRQHHQLVRELRRRPGAGGTHAQDPASLGLQQGAYALEHILVPADHDRQVSALGAVRATAHRRVEQADTPSGTPPPPGATRSPASPCCAR